MFRRRIRTHILVLVTLALPLAAAVAEDINWSTIDGGGAMFSSGAGFTLGATIGQPDAGPSSGPMTGGPFSLTGGFWAVAQVCNCAGDMDGNGARNGRDVQTFVQCVTGLGPACSCADFDGNSLLNASDIASFVAALLAGPSCP